MDKDQRRNRWHKKRKAKQRDRYRSFKRQSNYNKQQNDDDWDVREKHFFVDTDK